MNQPKNLEDWVQSNQRSLGDDQMKFAHAFARAVAEATVKAIAINECLCGNTHGHLSCFNAVKEKVDQWLGTGVKK